MAHARRRRHKFAIDVGVGVGHDSYDNKNNRIARRQTQRVATIGKSVHTLSDYTTAGRLLSQVLTTDTKIDLGHNIREKSMGCTASSSGPAPNPAFEYFSARIQTLMERRSEFSSDVEATIEALKDHWTEVDLEPEDEVTTETNLEVFRSFQQQFPGDFFIDWSDDVVVGRKIGEGGQAEILEVVFAGESERRMLVGEPGSMKMGAHVVKVFKAGISLRALQKQWPLGILRADGLLL